MPQRPTLLGARGVVASEHYLSAEAGLRILHAGGNAFDAAIAATLAEGVVNPHMHTFGGELSALVYTAHDRRVFAVNGDTVAPRAATIEWFRAHGLSLIPMTGLLPAGPPAIPHALLIVLARFGTLSFAAVVTPALELAEGGFPLHPALHGPAPEHLLGDFSLTGSAHVFRETWPSSGAIYLPGGRLPEVGELVKNPDLGRTFRRLIAAEERAAGQGRRDGIAAAVDAFYRGEIADLIAAHAVAHGGLLAREDLHAYRSRIEPPVALDYHGWTVHKCGPWSQGPVFLQQLGLLAGFELRALEHDGAEYVHLLAEAAKLAFADREQYYGDPDFTDVPLAGLLSEPYAAARRALIDPRRASLAQRPGDPRGGRALLTDAEVFAARDWGRGTVYVAVVDRARNMASFTPSGGWIPTSPVIEGLGFPLGTRVQTFYLDPHHPNALVPGKHPRTTLTPTLVLRNGAPAMVLGTQGGDQQDQWTLQVFLNLVEFGMEVQEAIEAPRFSSVHFPSSFFPHHATPGGLRVEGRIPAAVRDALGARGHTIEVEDDWVAGDVLCIRVDAARGVLRAGADPRGEVSGRMPSYAIAW
ncbi:MAG: gamma-glutamyltransferase family protein [Deltaproteobacteria bacterium]|nr:MAG: gamma-glutamyltransferase family protein [Deltaproteobacteria bacterium]